VHAEKGIRLADGQVWTFPAPGEQGASSPDAAFDAEYLDLIRAILEAEDGNEGRLAELAFAMLLLGHQHQLTPLDYQRLFMFTPESPELAESQAAFHDLALAHVDHLRAMGFFSRPAGEGGHAPGVLSRIGGRLRNQWPIRAWYQITRKGEVLS